jgi:hypothetical protein
MQAGAFLAARLAILDPEAKVLSVSLSFSRFLSFCLAFFLSVSLSLALFFSLPLSFSFSLLLTLTLLSPDLARTMRQPS